MIWFRGESMSASDASIGSGCLKTVNQNFCSLDSTMYGLRFLIIFVLIPV